jgi:hypothetical protein
VEKRNLRGEGRIYFRVLGRRKSLDAPRKRGG